MCSNTYIFYKKKHYEDEAQNDLLYIQVLCELHEPWTEVDPFSRQTEVNINMRIALAEWMAEVQVRFIIPYRNPCSHALDFGKEL